MVRFISAGAKLPNNPWVPLLPVVRVMTCQLSYFWTATKFYLVFGFFFFYLDLFINYDHILSFRGDVFYVILNDYED